VIEPGKESCSGESEQEASRNASEPACMTRHKHSRNRM
jgi:hypothetical protein